MTLPENVYRTKDGALLLTGGGHSTAAYFNGDMKASEASRKNFWENHAARRRWCAQNGIDFRMLVFPDKLAPFAEDMQDHPGIESLYLRDYEPQQNGGQVAYLEMKKSDYLLTDTHLSAQGIKSATKQYLSFLGIMDHTILDEAYRACLTTDENYVGDLGVKCEPNISEKAEILKGIRKGKFATNNVLSGNDGIIDINVNPAVQSRPHAACLWRLVFPAVDPMPVAVFQKDFLFAHAFLSL